MNYEHILIEKKEGVALVTINRHEKRNTIAARTIDELESAFDEMAADDEVKAVVIRGAGGKAFSAGADLEEGFDLDGDVKAFVRRGQAVFQKIERFHKPVVAAVEGYAFGGGFELMLACDMSVVADNAVLGQPEAGRGVIPGWGGTQKGPRIAGKNLAMEMLLLGNRIRAEQAKELGFVNRIVPKEKVIEEAMELAARLGRQPAVSVKMIKDAVLRGLETTLEAGLEIEAENFATAFRESGIADLLRKRK
ncbi:MAG TPA: enoyl-CoA hydratase/isomerase family protein [bacterium]|nr:enoyl-CoA hydratase/isomerase family protein [bacterium]